jgi:toxin ParE1/3/4
VARYRLSRLAENDVSLILATSEEQWGIEGRRRYAAVIAAAFRKVAQNLEAPVSRDRAELSAGLRSIHLRHVRISEPAARVRRPVHIVYYRAVTPDLIEVVRLLHERMEPRRHLGAEMTD